MIDGKFVTAKSGIKNKTDLNYVVGLLEPFAKKLKGKSDDEVWGVFLKRYKAPSKNGTIGSDALLTALDLNESKCVPLSKQLLAIHEASKKKSTEVTLYIDFLNKKKNHQPDKKEFTGKDFQDAHDQAYKWGSKNIAKFSMDMIMEKK